MLDSLWRSLYPRRSSSDREKALTVLLLLAVAAFYALPLFDCPCGGAPKFAIVGTPTGDRVEFTMRSCHACRGSGRLSLFDRWFGETPLEPARRD
ncbi:MAG: hypothetical protein HY293_02855 [Planctomycetes bacterium]|nr:hypothetical protein [Planctomycetota bacterium]